MSQLKKLERILDLLINENIEQAEEELHNLVVEKARNIYEELVSEEDEDEDDMDEEMDESIGGDIKHDFTSEVEADRDDIESDELDDGDVGSEDDEVAGDFDYDDSGDSDEHEEDHASVEDMICDLSDQIADLTAEFQALMGGDDEMEMDTDMDMDMEPEMDMGMDAEFDTDDGIDMETDEMYMEATKLQDTVANPGMNKEGKLAGTGKNSKTGATGTASPYTKAPTKSIDGAKPVDFSKGGTGGEYTGPAGGDTTSAKNDTPSSNIDVAQSDVNYGEQTAEGDFVGTGKGSKKGATQDKSPLSSAPKKP